MWNKYFFSFVVSLFVGMILSSCSNESSIQELKDHSDIPILNRCAAGWDINYPSLQKTADAVSSVDMAIENFIVLKSGAESQARYSFIALGSSDESGIIIINGSNLKQVVIKDISVSTVRDWIKRFQNITNSKSLIVRGEVANISHVPCELFMAKYNSEETNLFMVGIQKQELYADFIKEFNALANNYIKNAYKTGEEEVLPLPTDSELKEFRSATKNDLFIEMRSWRK
ncbi:hypothetical protein [Aliikangiella coralliicola]|uniref:Uncharacterized protein n=1 Tax=Aliikangiella coralliicola TaxID=2592383 RepID=A0A545UEV7_9GAMM|nr:hypothetical protein [Aliikangiella coralliicola]TQV87923.1 hypothetical protein FLL46_11130 [Aliikangiella coralliicola]